MRTPFIELQNIHKCFHGIRVLSNVSLTLDVGETHGLLGCNGAGKSTLVRILAGTLQPDSGRILINGIPVRFSKPLDSIACGIAVSPQDLMLFEEMSVADNLFLTNLPRNRRFPIDYTYQARKACEILELLKLDISPDRKVCELAQSEKYLVQLGRCYLSSPKLLVLDELSASLTTAELCVVHQLINKLKRNGTAVLYITHRIQDILEASDRLTILRDGAIAVAPDFAKSSENELRRFIFGDSIAKLYPKLQIPHGKKLLELSHISNKYFNDVSLELHRGEIYGILGLSGSGRSRLLRAIAGIDPIHSGSISYRGRYLHGCFHSRNLDIAYIPEDRNVLALFKNMDSYQNTTISDMNQIAPHRIINLQKEAISCRNLFDRLGIRNVHPMHSVNYLSGGNKQKVMIARNLYSHCSIYLFDEPTQGIDTAGKVEIYNIITELARKGAGIILVSSDFSELTGMCDRILTICRGRVLDNCPASQISPTNVMNRFIE